MGYKINSITYWSQPQKFKGVEKSMEIPYKIPLTSEIVFIINFKWIIDDNSDYKLIISPLYRLWNICERPLYITYEIPKSDAKPILIDDKPVSSLEEFNSETTPPITPSTPSDSDIMTDNPPNSTKKAKTTIDHYNIQYLTTKCDDKYGIDLPVNTSTNCTILINVNETEVHINPCHYVDITNRSHIYLNPQEFILVSSSKDEKENCNDFILSIEKQPSLIVNNKSDVNIDIKYEDVIVEIPANNIKPIEWDSLCGFPYISNVNKYSQIHIFDAIKKYSLYVRNPNSSWSYPIILNDGKYNMVLEDKDQNENKYKYTLIVNHYGSTYELTIYDKIDNNSNNNEENYTKENVNINNMSVLVKNLKINMWNSITDKNCLFKLIVNNSHLTMKKITNTNIENNESTSIYNEYHVQLSSLHFYFNDLINRECKTLISISERELIHVIDIVRCSKNKYNSIPYYPSIVFTVPYVVGDVEEYQIYTIISYVKSIITELKQYNPNEIDLKNPELIPVKKNDKIISVIDNKIDEFKSITGIYIHIDNFTISPIRMKVTLKLKKVIYFGVSNLPLSLNSINGIQIYCQMKRFTKEVISNYITDLVLHSPMYIGSLDLIGSPVVLIDSIGKGINAFISQLRSTRSNYTTTHNNNNNSNILVKVASGSGQLLYYLSEGILSSINVLSSTLSNNITRPSKIEPIHNSYTTSTSKEEQSSYFSYITKPIGGLFNIITNTTSYIMEKTGMTSEIKKYEEYEFVLYYLNIKSLKHIFNHNFPEESYLFKCHIINSEVENMNVFCICNKKKVYLIDFTNGIITLLTTCNSDEVKIEGNFAFINEFKMKINKDVSKVINYENNVSRY